MKTSDTLLKAWSLLETVGWCRGTFAINKEGETTWPTYTDACAFCSLGAVIHVTGEELDTSIESPAARTLEKAAHQLGYGSIPDKSVVELNDNARPDTVEEMWMLATLLALADEESVQ